MMLRYTFGQEAAAKDIENAVEKTLQEGYRTNDLEGEDDKKLGTIDMGHKVATYLEESL